MAHYRGNNVPRHHLQARSHTDPRFFGAAGAAGGSFASRHRSATYNQGQLPNAGCLVCLVCSGRGVAIRVWSTGRFECGFMVV